MNNIAKFACCATVALTLPLLGAACTRTVSRGIDDDGVADEVKWPEASERKIEKEAISPNRENLAKLRKGLNKRDISNLLGVPHFQEMFGAREWDYLFKYRDGDADKICRFKIIFDDDKLAGTFHWNPEGCGRHFGIGTN